MTMKFNIFSLHPEIFESFVSTSLIARGVSQNIIEFELINWRQKYGIGNYHQVDDRPFGGGSGMVLMLEPILKALTDTNFLSDFVKSKNKLAVPKVFDTVLPPNAEFYNYSQNNNSDSNKSQVTISLTPRGFPINQQVCEWLAGNFDQLNILCGRYEGFDSRISNFVDLELSLGSFVTNGGEVPAMALVEAVSRLTPGFITKDTSVLHDSFSSELNDYSEQKEFVVGKKKLEQIGILNQDQSLNLAKSKSFGHSAQKSANLFNNLWWEENILPFIEHPQFTRPEISSNLAVPKVLIEGDHKKIQQWRQNWYKPSRLLVL